MTRISEKGPEWTSFQEARPYGAKYDLRTDFVMVYGLSDDLPERIEGWKKAGYTIHLMTGVSWGSIRIIFTGDSTAAAIGTKPKWTVKGNTCSTAPTCLIWFRRSRLPIIWPPI
ncbi:hypothetical protein N6H14_27685 [Paenibacillus sp. CC-CFT747]|nr:hypothetical protein N6H14_27685 [Paenibacillus sp. CC-CFT747]